jgi:hypothetical protein
LGHQSGRFGVVVGDQFAGQVVGDAVDGARAALANGEVGFTGRFELEPQGVPARPDELGGFQFEEVAAAVVVDEPSTAVDDGTCSRVPCSYSVIMSSTRSRDDALGVPTVIAQTGIQISGTAATRHDDTVASTQDGKPWRADRRGVGVVAARSRRVWRRGPNSG